MATNPVVFGAFQADRREPRLGRRQEAMKHYAEALGMTAPAELLQQPWNRQMGR